jgi:hypothetical protein
MAMNPYLILGGVAAGAFFTGKAFASKAEPEVSVKDISVKIGDTFKTKVLDGKWEASYPVGQGPNKATLDKKIEEGDSVQYKFKAINKTEKGKPFRIVLRGPTRIIVLKVTVN